MLAYITAIRFPNHTVHANYHGCALFDRSPMITPNNFSSVYYMY